MAGGCVGFFYDLPHLCRRLTAVDLRGSSISYRIAVGPQAGRKVFTLQTLPAGDPDDSCGNTVAKVAGFSLHAGVAAKAYQRKKLERLCRYISRPAVSEQRLSLTSNGNIRYQLKTPYRNGDPKVGIPRRILRRNKKDYIASGTIPVDPSKSSAGFISKCGYQYGYSTRLQK